MSDLDKISLAIGKMQGSQEALLRAQEDLREDMIKGQDDLWREMKSMNDTLTGHRLKTMGIAGTISAGVAAMWHYFTKGAH